MAVFSLYCYFSISSIINENSFKMEFFNVLFKRNLNRNNPYKCHLYVFQRHLHCNLEAFKYIIFCVPFANHTLHTLYQVSTYWMLSLVFKVLVFGAFGLPIMWLKFTLVNCDSTLTTFLSLASVFNSHFSCSTQLSPVLNCQYILWIQ